MEGAPQIDVQLAKAPWPGEERGGTTAVVIFREREVRVGGLELIVGLEKKKKER